LLAPVVDRGRRTLAPPDLPAAQARRAAAVAGLPAALRSLDPAASPYPVVVSAALSALAVQAEHADGAAGGDPGGDGGRRRAAP
jgi:nicotinate phosphoribosyltransferase